MKRPNPGNMWRNLRKESIPSLGEQFWEDLSGLVPLAGPRTDSYVGANAVWVLMELPGLSSPDKLQISVRGHILHIRGEVPYPYPVDEEQLTLSERFFGSFHRKVELPGAIRGQEVRAKLECGLLTVTVPLAEEEEWIVPVDGAKPAQAPAPKGDDDRGEIIVSGPEDRRDSRGFGGVQRKQSADRMAKPEKNQ